MADPHPGSKRGAADGTLDGALANRRYLKKAPNGWIYISSNPVVYPDDEVEHFVSERKMARRPPIKRRSRNGEDPAAIGLIRRHHIRSGIETDG